MRRTEENEKLIQELRKKSFMNADSVKIAYLGDISRSLAVIADALLMINAEKKDEISKAADEYFEKLINGEFGEGGPHATD